MLIIYKSATELITEKPSGRNFGLISVVDSNPGYAQIDFSVQNIYKMLKKLKAAA